MKNETSTFRRNEKRMAIVPNSKRQGKSHKTWFGVASPNTCIARLQANMNYFDGTITCEYCLTTLSESACTPLNIYELDHLTPVAYFDALGIKRNHTASNLGIACKTCNREKSAKALEDYANAETIARIREICKLASNLNKIEFQQLGRLLAMQSKKVARLFDGGKYLHAFWKA